VISKEHKSKKHAKISRPFLGRFGRNEWGFIGAPCGNIQKVAKGIITHLRNKCNVAYVDAEHSSNDEETVVNDMPYFAYTDKITYHQFNLNGTLNEYQQRQYYNESDIILINANHFKAQKQIVVVNEKKRESLARKLDKLKNVSLLLLDDGENEIFDFLQEHLYNRINEIPVFRISEVERIANFIYSDWQKNIPAINGIVLAGGRSERMGKDKSLIAYHGEPQREYVANLLSGFCENVYISCRADQTTQIESKFDLLPDTFMGMGPMGAILSSFQKYSDKACLVVACDLPLLDKTILEELLNQRNPSKIATAFHNQQTGFTEPLITLWEPKAYPIMLQFIGQGYTCPRKVLINSDIQELTPKNPTALMNVNRPEELEEVKRILAKK